MNYILFTFYGTLFACYKHNDDKISYDLEKKKYKQKAKISPIKYHCFICDIYLWRYLVKLFPLVIQCRAAQD